MVPSCRFYVFDTRKEMIHSHFCRKPQLILCGNHRMGKEDKYQTRIEREEGEEEQEEQKENINE